jgi:hypothetical protein
VLAVSPWSTSSAKTKNQKKGRTMPFSLKNVSRSVNSTRQEFTEDSKYVHNNIQSLIVGEDAEQWVKDHKRCKNGRTDFLTLVAHFTGEGNNTRRIGDAELLEKTLQYKDERAMAYQTFLAKTKHMNDIFEEVGEPKPESAKIRSLLDGIRCTDLRSIVKAIRAGMTLDPNAYTFTTPANMIASQVLGKNQLELHASKSWHPLAEFHKSTDLDPLF